MNNAFRQGKREAFIEAARVCESECVGDNIDDYVSLSDEHYERNTILRKLAITFRRMAEENEDD